MGAFFSNSKVVVGVTASCLAGVVGFYSDLKSIMDPPPSATTVVVAPVLQKTDIDSAYQTLENAKLARTSAGNSVAVDVMFLGVADGSAENYYSFKGVDTTGKILINHREPHYASSNTPLGNSDIAIPPFAISVPESMADQVLKIKKYQIVKLTGVVSIVQPSMNNAKQPSIVELNVSKLSL